MAQEWAPLDDAARSDLEAERRQHAATLAALPPNDAQQFLDEFGRHAAQMMRIMKALHRRSRLKKPES